MLTHLLAAVLAAALTAGLILSFDGPASGDSGGSPPGGGPVPGPAARTAPLATSAQGIVMKVEPGIVYISTKLQYSSEAAAGTGMVLNSGGLVLTNNHVIEDATSITATVATTGKVYTARVVGYDKAGDIALIQLEGASRLATVPLGNSSSARDHAGSATSETLHGMTQVNADIVAGDSGGPLGTAYGVIGMDTAGNDTSYQQAVGFAIPINTALSVARQIAAGKSSATITIGYPPFLGIFIGASASSDPRAQVSQTFAVPSPTPTCYTSNAGQASPATGRFRGAVQGRRVPSCLPVFMGSGTPCSGCWQPVPKISWIAFTRKVLHPRRVITG